MNVGELNIPLECVLEYLFRKGYDGLYIHNCPRLVDNLKCIHSQVGVFAGFELEFIPNTELIRLWTPAGWKHKQEYKVPENKSDIIKRLNEQMMLAIEAGDVKRILELRKQIRELGN